MKKADILVVEDEVLIAQDIREILEEHSYNVLDVVDNGPDAARVARTKKPDIILMDIIIKGPWDGIRTTEEIHAVIDTPVIYLTSHADKDRLERAKITEPYGYITKPFEEKTLYSTIEMALYRRKTESEKQALKENVIHLNRELSLTDNERKVFYGLIRYPRLNDIELGQLFRLKRSTVTSIRNRLLKEEYYATYRIPDFCAIGCEMLTMINCSLDAHKDPNASKESVSSKDPKISDEMLKNVIAGMIKDPEQVYAAWTTKKFIGFCMSKNYADIKKHLDAVSNHLKSNGISNELSFTHFPLHSDTFRNIFNFSAYMKKRLEIGQEHEYPEYAEKRLMKARSLSRNEKLILYALVKYPSSDDTSLSSKTGIPRPSLSQTRRLLVKEGFLHIINIPSTAKLKSELMVMNYVGIDVEHDKSKVLETENQLLKLPSNTFFMSDDAEAYTINIYDDYSEFETEKNYLAQSMQDHHLKIKQELILLVQDLNPIYFNPAPIMKKILGIDPRF